MLGLPLLAAAQAQKHVTHNEALLRLDALTHLSVVTRALASPPPAVDGERYLVAAAPSGAWAGQPGMLALAQGGGWVFVAPRKGWRLWVEDEARLLAFDGAQWRDPFTITELPAVARLGINATADDVNRLAVASAAQPVQPCRQRPSLQAQQECGGRHRLAALPDRLVRPRRDGADRQRRLPHQRECRWRCLEGGAGDRPRDGRGEPARHAAAGGAAQRALCTSRWRRRGRASRWTAISRGPASPFRPGG